MKAGAAIIVIVIGVAALVAACGSDKASPPDLSFSDDAGTDAPTITQGPREIVCDDKIPLPTELSCTGLYEDFASKKIAATARGVAPGNTLWSDGASKSRWLFLPPGSKIDTTNMDEWVFPVGTKVWKEFQLDGKTLETRLWKKIGDDAWVFTTYVREPDGSGAHRNDSGVPNAAGTYEIPNKVHCSQCHNGHADRLLGIEAISLGLTTATGLTLTKMKEEGLLSAPPATTTITLPGDEKAQRALGWLHVNCGITCHSPNAAGTAGFTGMLLRLSAKSLLAGAPVAVIDTDAYKTTVGKPFVSATYLDDPRFVLYKRITAKDPDKSVLVAAVSERGPAQMPPIVSHKVDDQGVTFLRDWIATLP